MNIIHGDSLDKLKELEDNSVDSIVSDPPYGLSFMGKKWDYDVPSQEIWEECLRVLKPGGYLLAFAGTRTQHRMAVRIEDAGFEIRDMIAWVYGSGFPKSHNIGKAVDKLQGNEREDMGRNPAWRKGNGDGATTSTGWAKPQRPNKDKGTSEWEGYGTALKPALEPITVARKPILEKTVAQNVLKYGTGGINIDGCRVGTEEVKETTTNGGKFAMWNKDGDNKGFTRHNGNGTAHTLGRFPANLIHDGSDEVVGLFPETKSGNLNSGHKRGDGTGNSFMGGGGTVTGNYGGDSGSASRFFQKCKFDNECFLCYNTLHRANINENICNNTNVSGVKKNLKTTQVIKENIVPLDVEDLQGDKLVQLVKSVGNLCQKCTTDFVQSLAVILESQKDLESQEELQVIQDFTTNSKKCILLQNLVSFAEKMDSIDTTLTTTSLLKLFGSVNRVITNYTQEIEKSEQKRFLYCPKASKSERNKGCEGLEEKETYKQDGSGNSNEIFSKTNKRVNPTTGKLEERKETEGRNQNNHPTVKPISLMRYLVRLVTPKGGTVLDPFMGSGTTGIGAKLEGFDFIGIEREAEYIKIAEARINAWEKEKQKKLV